MYIYIYTYQSYIWVIFPSWNAHPLLQPHAGVLLLISFRIPDLFVNVIGPWHRKYAVSPG